MMNSSFSDHIIPPIKAKDNGMTGDTMMMNAVDGPVADADFNVIWAAPILAGRAEAWRRLMQELLGDRRSEYEAACRRLGVHTMVAWVVETAGGDYGIVAVTARQPQQVMAGLAGSDLPFSRWFRSQLAALYGPDIVDFARLPLTDRVLSWPESLPDRIEGGHNTM
jgi:hypothetical protein